MDIIADALTRIRNAGQKKKKEVILKRSKVIDSMVEILKDENFINNYDMKDGEIMVELRYRDDEHAITSLEKVSKPGQRIYVKASELTPVLSGRGIGIVSTPHGVMTVEEASEKGIGGEYICKIW